MSPEPVKRGFTKPPTEGTNSVVDDVSNTFAKNVRVSNAAAAASSREPAKLLDIPLGDHRSEMGMNKILDQLISGL